MKTLMYQLKASKLMQSLKIIKKRERNKKLREANKIAIKPILDCKKCSTCQIERDILHFDLNCTMKDGYSPRCKECRKEHYNNTKHLNSIEKNNYNKMYRQLNKTKDKANITSKTCGKCKETKPVECFVISSCNLDGFAHRCKLCNSNTYKENPEPIKQQARLHKKNNRKYYNHIGATRNANKMRAMPKWADLGAIKEFYKNCPDGYDVDHIIPLKHPKVQGLHVLENLQYLSRKENNFKRNKFDGTLDNNGWRNT